MTLTVRLAVGTARAAALVMRRSVRSLCSSAPAVSKEPLLFDRLVQPKWLLLRAYGFAVSDVRQLFRRHKALLPLPAEDLQRVLRFFDQDVASDESFPLRFTRQEIRDVVVRCPALLRFSVERAIRPLLLLWMRDLRLSEEQAKRLVIHAPQLFSYPLSHMQSHTFFFHNRQAEASEIVQILKAMPDVLDVPFKELVRFHDYWKQEQLSDRDFMTMVTKRPSVLRLSFDRVMRPMIQYMIFVCRHRRGARLFVDHPAFFELSLDDLSRNVEYLLKMGITSRALLWMARSCPRILEMDLERELKPRVGALRDLGVVSDQRLAEILPEYPEILTDMVIPGEPVEDRGGEPWSVHVTSCPIPESM